MHYQSFYMLWFFYRQNSNHLENLVCVLTSLVLALEGVGHYLKALHWQSLFHPHPIQAKLFLLLLVLNQAPHVFYYPQQELGLFYLPS